MIKNIEFFNFRNLNRKFDFTQNLNVIIGKNNSGKSNLLDGIRLALSSINDDYFKVDKSDFYNSDDSTPIIIKVELEVDSIPSLNFYDDKKNKRTGFQVIIRKTQRGRYIKEVLLLNGSNVDFEILKNDEKIPNVTTIPLSRIDNLFTNGMTTSISNFLNSEEDYIKLKESSKEQLRNQLSSKINEFTNFCKKFGQNLDIEFADPKITDEKVFVVDGDTGKEHGYRIGSGYKSVANIIINSMNEGNNLILIDEIENHLHPSLIRTLLREIRSLQNSMIIGTTHSAVVLNELKMEEMIDISGKNLGDLEAKTLQKLNVFLHPGRGEMVLADNIILVEGYTEELLLMKYLQSNNKNWTIINVAGVMFEPYIELALFLNKHIIVISDNDKSTVDGINPSSRFVKLKSLCSENKITLIEIDNTLESDLYENGYLEECVDLLKQHEKFQNIYIAKDKKKIEITNKLVEKDIDLSSWHVIKEIEDEFRSN